MSKISDIIFNKFFEYTQARQPKNYTSMTPPPDYDWSTTEVRGLIETIANFVNSYIADRYFKEENNKI